MPGNEELDKLESEYKKETADFRTKYHSYADALTKKIESIRSSPEGKSEVNIKLIQKIEDAKTQINDLHKDPQYEAARAAIEFNETVYKGAKFKERDLK